MKPSFLTVAVCLWSFCASVIGNETLETQVNTIDPSLEQIDTIPNASAFTGKLDELLTVEIAAEISGFDASKATKVHENKASLAFGGKTKPPIECHYLWSNGRTRAVTSGGNTMKTPYDDKVAIFRVSNTTLERFKRNYGMSNDEQKQASMKKLAEEADKNNTAGAGQAMTTVATDMVNNMKVEEVTSVGEAATWYENTNKLEVFVRGLKFCVLVDISDDKKVNREKSIELANTIIPRILSLDKR